MNLTNSIIFAFKETFKWSNIKFALINGLFITVFWIFIANFVWDYLILFSSKVIEFFPFSMVRADAAWIINSVLFFQITLITFAILMAFFGEFYLKKNKEKYTIYTIITFLMSSIFWGLVWFFKGSILYNEILKVLMWFPFQTLEKGIAFFMALYIVYNAIIVSSLFITSIFSQKIILHSFSKEDITNKHYFSSIVYTIRDSIIFFLVSLLLFIVLFIPVINIIVQIILWLWLFKDTIVTDALYLNFGENKIELKKSNQKAIYLISFISSLFNFIPIINLFGPIFGEIAMFNYFKEIKNNKEI